MRAAVVVNPTKHPDRARFRAEVTKAMGAHGWSEPLWLETTPEETGRGLAEAAVAEQVDVFLRRARTGRVARSVFRELRVQLDRPQLWELDGEVMGTTSELVVVVQPGRLLVRVPR